MAADPYGFAVSPAPVDPQKPGFLQSPWEKLLVADFQADSRLYAEVEAYFGSLLTLPLFLELGSQLDSVAITLPPPPAPDQGDKIKNYSNGAVFTYPGSPGAQITVLSGGYYEILYADKSRFRSQGDGSYEQIDPLGNVTLASYPKQSQIIVTTFVVSRGLNRLLDWDLVTTTSTGNLPLASARVHYAQSYALVSALLKKYGVGKVAQYIQSFRRNTTDSASISLKTVYRSNFKAVFGVDFDQALKLLDPPAAKS